jgi:hypothetical protein
MHETMVDLFSLILMLQNEMCSQMEIEDCNPIEPRILLRQLNTVKVIYVSSMDERVQRALETIFITLECQNLEKLNFQNIC